MPGMIPDFAPGCFGSALNYSDKDMICRACQFQTACEPAHRASKEALRARFGIPVRQRTSSAISAASDDPASTEMPKKIVTLLMQIKQDGINIKTSLQTGLNPFKDKLQFLAVACHLVMKMPKVNQNLIAQGCVKMLGCKQETAEVYARQAIIVLTHAGAVTNDDGVISLKRG